MSHYFINDPQLNKETKMLKTTIFDNTFSFLTSSGVFSKDNLDYGTRFLLENIEITNDESKILDIGCGYGAIGIIIKKMYPKCEVLLTDVNTQAVELSKKNADLNHVDVRVYESNLFDSIKDDQFQVIISNPPIHAGKKLVYQLFSESFSHLDEGGRLYIVMRKSHGVESAINYLSDIFTKVLKVNRSKGFYIICAIK